MTTKVAYLHGIGGPDGREEWLSALNHELARAGYERLLPGDVIDCDYSSILDGAVGRGLHEPPITAGRSNREASEESAYFDNRSRFQFQLAASAADSSWLQAAPAPVADAAARFISRVENYRSSADVRSAVWAHVLSRLPARGRIVLVGHSLGSVIAADVACRVPESVEIAALITVASPLGGVPALRKGSTVLASTGGFPYGRIKLWVNIYSPADIVTVGRGVARYYPVALDVPVSTGPVLVLPYFENHGIALHAQHPAVAQAVGWSVFGDPAPEAARNLPAARLDPIWDGALLTFAYADALLETIPADQAERRRALRLAMEESARRVEEQARAARAKLERLVKESEGPEREQASEALNRVASYPTAHLLMDRAATQLRGRLAPSDMPSYAIALLNGFPLPPFDVEVGLSKERVEALAILLDRVHGGGESGEGESLDFAASAKAALDQANKVMKIEYGGWVKWAAVGAAGVALVAGTLITAGMMAPAGAAGAAAVTAALAAFGPGGMVGGIATIAALTGAGAATAAAGGIAAAVENAEEQLRLESQRRAEIRSAIIELAVTAQPQQLKSSLAAFVAVVILQEKLAVPTARKELFFAVQQSLATLRSDLVLAERVGPKSGYSKALEKKVEYLERAADWLRPREELSELMLRNQQTSSKEITEG